MMMLAFVFGVFLVMFFIVDIRSFFMTWGKWKPFIVFSVFTLAWYAITAIELVNCINYGYQIGLVKNILLLIVWIVLSTYYKIIIGSIGFDSTDYYH